MIALVMEVDAPAGLEDGVKEDLAMFLERYGRVYVRSAVEQRPEQTRLWGGDRRWT